MYYRNTRIQVLLLRANDLCFRAKNSWAATISASAEYIGRGCRSRREARYWSGVPRRRLPWPFAWYQGRHKAVLLRKLQREQEPRSPFVFTTERGSPFTTAGFARMVERAGEAKLGFQGSPAHAAARLWLRAGKQGPRYAGVAGLPRPQEYPAHGAIHRVVAGQVQRLLEMTEFVWLRGFDPGLLHRMICQSYAAHSG